MHPVSEGTLMYRLHKRFSTLELERTYGEIEQLQVSRARPETWAAEGRLAGSKEAART